MLVALQTGQRAGPSRPEPAEIFDAGAQRISVGGALAWTAIGAAARAAEAIHDSGDFSALASPGSDRVVARVRLTVASSLLALLSVAGMAG